MPDRAKDTEKSKFLDFEDYKIQRKCQTYKQFQYNVGMQRAGERAADRELSPAAYRPESRYGGKSTCAGLPRTRSTFLSTKAGKGIANLRGRGIEEHGVPRGEQEVPREWSMGVCGGRRSRGRR